MAYHGRIEIGFHDSDRASAFYESKGTDTGLWGPLALFAAYSIRTLVDLGSADDGAKALSTYLAETTSDALAGPRRFNGSDVQLVAHPGTPGRKQFMAELEVHHDDVPRFEFATKGFGIHPREIGDYAPNSVVVFLRYLGGRYLGDREFHAALADTARMVGMMHQSGHLSAHGQEHTALITAYSATRGNPRLRSFPWTDDKDR